MSRLTREMFCLMEGRHVHPSTLYPGGVGTVPTPQLFTDYLVRLMKYIDFVKRVVPLHDDLFDFFYEALPGYERGRAAGASCSAAGARSRTPTSATTRYEDMTHWGRAMYVTPGVVVDGKLRHHRPRRDQPRHPHPARQLVLRRLGRARRRSSTHDPLGNPVDKRHPWNQTTIPQPQKRDFDGKYSWVMTPRWYDKHSDHLALDTGGGPLARLWTTALAGMVDIGYVKATGNERRDQPAARRVAAARCSSNGRSRSGPTPSSATARAPTSRPTPRHGAVLRRAGAGASCARDVQDVGALQGARRRRSAAASTRRCAACCRITW